MVSFGSQPYQVLLPPLCFSPASPLQIFRAPPIDSCRRFLMSLPLLITDTAHGTLRHVPSWSTLSFQHALHLMTNYRVSHDIFPPCSEISSLPFSTFHRTLRGPRAYSAHFSFKASALILSRFSRVSDVTCPTFYIT
jgi:hypothetical protein